VGVRDLLCVGQLNRRFHRIYSDASLWKPLCMYMWNDWENFIVTSTDWKDMFVYRYFQYKHVSCVIVGDPGSGKKTLLTAFDGMVSGEGWKRGAEKKKAVVCVESFFNVPIMFNLVSLHFSQTDEISVEIMEEMEKYSRGEKKVDVFLVCVPASDDKKMKQDLRLEWWLTLLDRYCKGVARMIVVTKQDFDPYNNNPELKMHSNRFKTTSVMCSSMTNHGLIQVFDTAQQWKRDPKLRPKPPKTLTVSVLPAKPPRLPTRRTALVSHKTSTWTKITSSKNNCFLQ